MRSPGPARSCVISPHPRCAHHPRNPAPPRGSLRTTPSPLRCRCSMRCSIDFGQVGDFLSKSWEPLATAQCTLPAHFEDCLMPSQPTLLPTETGHLKINVDLEPASAMLDTVAGDGRPVSSSRDGLGSPLPHPSATAPIIGASIVPPVDDDSTNPPRLGKCWPL